MSLGRATLALLDDVGRQFIEILQLLAGRGIRVVGVVVEFDKFLGVER